MKPVLSKGFFALLEEAEQAVESLTPEQLMESRGDDKDLLLVDLRDIRELQREGKIPGAFHMPRGMMEFWIDPESPYFKGIFAEHSRWVFYCNKGWRSALTTHTAMQMGVTHIAHLAGGFSAWVDAGGEVEEVPKR
ncbi:rhodanese-like domain-containing protein [Aestuariirhabdus litorea]|uniref:Rhodanese-like domain-containing protein n=1 Tax=Aestuariirhabdus litorea TaxID=2528527 RepID=A0A3P3VN49_9GAMM|nr:rhodanese-like domain-containing protein [Aestuariirhabdus litorea]RRJ84125.1 rhodanese-like domain-containing protein [Aestuariirhabdus litorea]RWW97344.1 rhodanese-like domain-containing protein [Endozoicomonadaceae bacterium GTF-13]